MADKKRKRLRLSKGTNDRSRHKPALALKHAGTAGEHQKHRSQQQFPDVFDGSSSNAGGEIAQTADGDLRQVKGQTSPTFQRKRRRSQPVKTHKATPSSDGVTITKKSMQALSEDAGSRDTDGPVMDCGIDADPSWVSAETKKAACQWLAALRMDI